MRRGFAGRLDRIEARAAVRTVAIEVPYGMETDTALAVLGLRREDGTRLIVVQDFAGRAPRLVDSAEDVSLLAAARSRLPPAARGRSRRACRPFAQGGEA